VFEKVERSHYFITFGVELHNQSLKDCDLHSNTYAISFLNHRNETASQTVFSTTLPLFLLYKYSYYHRCEGIKVYSLDISTNVNERDQTRVNHLFK